MATGRYDVQIAGALERLEALRRQEAALWTEVKASVEAERILRFKWESAVTALRREQEHHDAIALIQQFEEGLKCSAT